MLQDQQCKFDGNADTKEEIPSVEKEEVAESILEIAEKCRGDINYFKSLSYEIKKDVIEYAKNNFMFIPGHMR